MDRRSFFKRVAGIAVAIAAKDFPVLSPAAAKIKPALINHGLLTPADISREALRILHNQLMLHESINKSYTDQIGPKTGRLTIRKPVCYRKKHI